MKNSCLLNLSYPTYQIAPPFTNTVAILETRDKTSTCNWLFSDIAGICYDNNFGYMLAYLGPQFPYKSCCLLQNYIIPREYILKNFNIIKDLKFFINEGYYVLMLIDTQFIPNYKYVNGQRKKHDILIFGYDENSMVFHIADYFPIPAYGGFRKYQKATASYSDIVKSVISMCNMVKHGTGDDAFDPFDGINIIKPINDGCYDFNISKFIYLCKCYLESQIPSNVIYKLPLQEIRNMVYGNRVYDCYIRDIGIMWDFTSLYALHQSHRLMKDRIIFLRNSGYIINDQLIADVLVINEKSSILVNQLLRSMIKGFVEVENIRYSLQIIKEKENKLYEDIMKNIVKFV